MFSLFSILNVENHSAVRVVIGMVRSNLKTFISDNRLLRIVCFEYRNNITNIVHLVSFGGLYQATSLRADLDDFIDISVIKINDECVSTGTATKLIQLQKENLMCPTQTFWQ